ncbi:MAG: hypothetical protein LC808_03120 [Actinobacteria bacterium]|nr:hypothetical protein [Actinomycetota bacterium]
MVARMLDPALRLLRYWWEDVVEERRRLVRPWQWDTIARARPDGWARRGGEHPQWR